MLLKLLKSPAVSMFPISLLVTTGAFIMGNELVAFIAILFAVASLDVIGFGLVQKMMAPYDDEQRLLSLAFIYDEGDGNLEDAILTLDEESEFAYRWFHIWTLLWSIVVMYLGFGLDAAIALSICYMGATQDFLYHILNILSFNWNNKNNYWIWWTPTSLFRKFVLGKTYTGKHATIEGVIAFFVGLSVLLYWWKP